MTGGFTSVFLLRIRVPQWTENHVPTDRSFPSHNHLEGIESVSMCHYPNICSQRRLLYKPTPDFTSVQRWVYPQVTGAHLVMCLNAAVLFRSVGWSQSSKTSSDMYSLLCNFNTETILTATLHYVTRLWHLPHPKGES